MIPISLIKSLRLSLLNIDRCVDNKWNYSQMISPFVRIYLVEGGDGCLFQKNKKYVLKKGWMYLMPDFTFMSSSSKTFFKHYYLHMIVNVEGQMNLFDMLPFRFEKKATFEEIQLMQRLFLLNPDKKLKESNPRKYHKSDLLENNNHYNNPEEVANAIEVQGIMLQLLSGFIDVNSKQIAVKFNEHHRLHEAVNYITQNLDSKIEINDLADKCYLSSDYFSRLFLNIMGLRPIEFINKKRLDRAQFLLVTTSNSLEQIATDVGVPNISYFLRLFKREIGMTPGQYRQVHRFI